MTSKDDTRAENLEDKMGKKHVEMVSKRRKYRDSEGKKM